VVETAEQRFGKELQRTRKQCGLSQEELGFQADIHVSYVSQLERGTKSPSLGVVLRLAAALGRPAWEMVRATEEGLAHRE